METRIDEKLPMIHFLYDEWICKSGKCRNLIDKMRICGKEDAPVKRSTYTSRKKWLYLIRLLIVDFVNCNCRLPNIREGPTAPPNFISETFPRVPSCCSACSSNMLRYCSKSSSVGPGKIPRDPDLQQSWRLFLKTDVSKTRLMSEINRYTKRYHEFLSTVTLEHQYKQIVLFN
jgi:hypothetical protein